MRTIGLFVLAGVALAQEPAPVPTVQPVATMSQLMISVIYPASDAIFYIERSTPKNDKEWEALQTSSMMLAETGNLLMMTGRARDQDKWMKDARMLVDVGAAAFKAAKAKDVPALLALNEQLYDSCVICHQDYRPGYRRRK
jgi:hypothetical protein